MRQSTEVETTSPARRLRRLVGITRTFAERTGDAALLRRTIAEQVGRLFDGYCLLGLISEDGRSWHLVEEFSPHPEHANELRRALGAVHPDIKIPTVTATVARTGRPVLIDDLGMCVPLRAQREVIGTIAVGRLGQGALRFDDGDVDLLQVLADHAAQTILLSRSAQDMQRELAEHQRTRECLRRTEEGLQQAAKMEALGRLAGGVAHDFNNILSVITGYSELLLSGESFARDDIEEIYQASLRASSLTKQLLAFSRKEPYAPRPVNLGSIIERMRPMLQRLLGKQVELYTAAPVDLPACLLDPSQAEQILMNLVINARDAMPHGGRLTIETTQVVLDGEYVAARPGATPGQHVVLSVTDTGTGMPEDVRVRIFEPFFTTKPKGIGTGLGLATVHGIVKQSGGNIYVYSEPGQGTTFRLEFPVACRVTAPVHDVEPALRAGRGAGTVLAVEGDAALRSLVCRTKR